MARHRMVNKRRTSRPTKACRASHLYGPGQAIGAGILRYICSDCGAVSIDITGADAPTSTGSLFESLEGVLGRT